MSRAVQASRGRAIEAHRGRAVLALARVAGAMVLLGMVLGAALTWWLSGVDDRQLAEVWLRQQINRHLNPAAIFQAQQQAGFVVTGETAEHFAAMKMLTRAGLAGSVLAVLLATGVTLLVRRQWINAAHRASLDQVKRGNRIATPRELALLVDRQAKSERPILIGGVPVPAGDEQRHALYVGKSGSGKTTALHGLVHQVAARGEHVLLFDPDTSYVATFYDPARGDIILSPWDARGARWNPLLDVTGIDDAYRLAAILLPKSQGMGENAVWYDQARAVIAHVVHHLVREGRTDLDDLAAILARAGVDELRDIVAGTEAARAFQAGAEKASASVAFMLTGPARIVAALASVPASAPAFSFDAFYRDLDRHDGPKPFVFLAVPRRARENGNPLVAAWIDAAASAILQRPLDTAPPAWLVIDEVGSLPAVQSLLTLLPEGRKHRVSVVLAIQSVAQLRQTYNDHGAEIVAGQTATQVMMAVGDPATARWLVELAGNVEAETTRPTETLGTDKAGRGSLATARERKTLLIDGELTGLGTGDAYLRLTGYPLAKVRVDPAPGVPIGQPDFIPATHAVRTVADHAPAPTAASRIEDRDDWLTTGGPF